ncbi:MAG: DNA gyrase inhibitor YacG [Pirellulales bacterium]
MDSSTPKAKLPRCPTCGATVDLKSSPAPPFCSTRCRQIDLGRWLGEQHSVPHAGREDEIDEPRSREEFEDS